MITRESQQRAVSLLKEISGLRAELSHLFSVEYEAGNLNDPVVQSVISNELLGFTYSVRVLLSGALNGYEAPETVGLIPTSSLPDFNLSAPAGTPDN